MLWESLAILSINLSKQKKLHFCINQKNTMKNFLFFLVLLIIANTGLAQTKPATDSATLPGFPVLRSYVAPDVVERAKKKYGRALYCIETSKAANCENSYLVGLIRNMRLSMEWMCDDPKMVLHIDRSAFVMASAY